jgi:hypothetical protein
VLAAYESGSADPVPQELLARESMRDATGEQQPIQSLPVFEKQR